MSKSKSNIDVGKRIRGRREILGYTRENLAEILEISVQFLADNEAGRKGMSYENLQKICDALCVSADYLLFGKVTYNNTDEIFDILTNVDIRYFPLIESSIKSLVQAVTVIKNSYK